MRPSASEEMENACVQRHVPSCFGPLGGQGVPCLWEPHKVKTRIHYLRGLTTVAANAGDGTVSVCRFQMSAFPPAPELWPPGRAAAGPIRIARSTFRFLVSHHERANAGEKNTLIKSSPRRNPRFTFWGSVCSPSHKNLGRSSIVMIILNERIRSRILRKTVLGLQVPRESFWTYVESSQS
jgi:hypothetical protein